MAQSPVRHSHDRRTSSAFPDRARAPCAPRRCAPGAYLLHDRARPHPSHELVLGDQLTGRLHQHCKDLERAAPQRERGLHACAVHAGRDQLPTRQIRIPSLGPVRACAPIPQGFFSLGMIWKARKKTIANNYCSSVAAIGQRAYLAPIHDPGTSRVQRLQTERTGRGGIEIKRFHGPAGSPSVNRASDMLGTLLIIERRGP